MNDHDLGFVPVAQSFAAGHIANGPYQAATHTFVAPESHPILPVKELAGDYVPLSVPTMDVPHLKSLSGMIVICLMTAIVLSMFGCMGRSDFTFPFLLFAYYVWCWESAWSTNKITQVARKQGEYNNAYHLEPVSAVYDHTAALIPASYRTIRNVQGVTLLLVLVTAIDAIWIFAAYNAWTCDFEDPPVQQIDLDTQREIPIDPLYCFNQETEAPLIITYTLHRWILRISNINFILKLIIIGLSTLWANQQRLNRRGEDELISSKPLGPV